MSNLRNKILEQHGTSIEHQKKVATEGVESIKAYLTDHIERGLPYPIRFSTSSLDHESFENYGLEMLNNWLKYNLLHLVNYSYSHPYHTFKIVIQL